MDVREPVMRNIITHDGSEYCSALLLTRRGDPAVPDTEHFTKDQISSKHLKNLRTSLEQIKSRNPDLDDITREGSLQNNSKGQIDCQNPSGTTGVTSIQYQAGRNPARTCITSCFKVHKPLLLAATIIRTYPVETTDCPDLSKTKIDDQTFGFPIETILNFLEQGLIYSAIYKLYTEITWKIIKVEADPRSPEADPRSPDGVKMLYEVKKAAKDGIEQFIKKGGKTTIKNVPVAGLACGTIFALWRLVYGDRQGAALEMASGVASTLPGAGTDVSDSIDAIILKRDRANLEQLMIEDKPR